MRSPVKLWIAALAAAALLQAAPNAKVRPAAVAGQFYPADPKQLAALVDELLKKAAPPPVENFVALVVPHAGYEFSGHVAATSHALLKGRKYTRVVVISPSHVDAFGFASVFDGAAYTTPLGQVPVDREFAAKLAKGSLVRLSSSGHTVSGERSEHALEVQLPFLQRVLGQFSLVPVVMGDQSYETCRALGIALAKLAGPDTLIVASSDLSHFHKYDDAVKLDRKTLKAIEEFDYLSMARNFESQVWEACGGGPIVAAMIAAERLGAKQARTLKYANSGDVTSDRSRVVGYGAIVLERAPVKQSKSGAAFTLGEAERNELLEIAHKSVETAVREHRLLDVSGSAFPTLFQERGAFVTLKIRGALRGCIGYASPIKPLYLTVRDVAAMAAVEDNRFRPVSIAELPQLEYEISVMSPLHHVLDTREIQVGRHGLVLKRGRREGLLLPQVPVEQGWDLPTFLEELCLKAGVPEGSWKAEDADLFSFTGLVFSERKSPAPRSKRTSAPPT
jgi:MEMO1 family protein